MPFINVENSGKGNNKGSCKALVNYLCKENVGKELNNREHFFSVEQNQINRLEVINGIDTNISRLGKGVSKFFMLTLNFSQREAGQVDNNTTMIRTYVREVMDLYAQNFNKGLRSIDLVWFAKIEYNRTFKGFEKEMFNGGFKQGDLKPGLNTHVHIIVSRKDRTQRLKLSPMTTHRRSTSGIIKSGFDRMNFKIKCEKCFDNTFNYQRKHDEFFIVKNALKNGSRAEKVFIKQSIYRSQSPLIAALSILKGAKLHYPTDDEEKKRKRKNENDQDIHY